MLGVITITSCYGNGASLIPALILGHPEQHETVSQKSNVDNSNKYFKLFIVNFYFKWAHNKGTCRWGTCDMHMYMCVYVYIRNC